MAGARQQDDRRTERRAAQRTANRNQVLDAAEVVFARAGLHNASMRAIAEEAGYSSAAIYLFFDNRQQLLAETLARRTDELISLLESTIGTAPDPLTALHTIIDQTLVLYRREANFWRMLSEVRTGLATVSELGDYASELQGRSAKIQELLSGVIRKGQRNRTIRNGDPQVLTRFYMVLNNEYINLNLETSPGASASEFHAFIDDAMRPTRA
jgi:TetR/AcrR family transcriptional regulator